MKKLIAVLLLLAMCFTLYACEEKPTETPATNGDTTINDKDTNKDTENKDTENKDTENETITVTKDNFFDYFTVQLDYQNLRVDNARDGNNINYFSVCDLVVEIYLIEAVTPSKVSFDLKITPYSRYGGSENTINKTVVLPASGSYTFTKAIKTGTMKTISVGQILGNTLDPIQPNVNSFSISVTNASGTLY